MNDLERIAIEYASRRQLPSFQSCQHCKMTIRLDATTCPYCRKNPRQSDSYVAVLIVVAVLLFAAAIGLI